MDTAGLAFVTSAYSSYSGCRQYREDIARAQGEVGTGVSEVDKLRAFFNHPGFIEATVERVRDALDDVPADARRNAQIVYTAHSISAFHGEHQRLCEATGRGTAAGFCGARAEASSEKRRAGLPEPQRGSGTALVGAGHSRLSAAE